MKTITLFIALLCASCHAEKTNIVCDNGLKDWASDTNHHFGVWCSQSIRIVQTPTNTFYAQFKDSESTNTTWIGLFEGDKVFDSLSICQWKVRRAFETKKEVTDAIQDAFKNK